MEGFCRPIDLQSAFMVTLQELGSPVKALGTSQDVI